MHTVMGGWRLFRIEKKKMVLIVRTHFASMVIGKAFLQQEKNMFTGNLL